ncbi:MAG: hypothetical protein J6W50_00285 [Bacteroidaceae bacterium]|nr:hypothetical protein [Bacteroidaceae bacterium]
MDCKEFKNIVCDLFDKEVDPQVKAQCDEHLSHCAECSEYYDQMLATTELLRPKHSPVPDRAGTYDKTVNSKLSNSKYVWLRIAAMFAGVLLLSGIAFATIYFVKTRESRVESNIRLESSPQGGTGGGQSVRFEEVRLDSILGVVSAHYSKAVSFDSDEAKGLKFIIEWEPDAPLADFIEGINMFDGLQLTLRRDTIFVELQEEKEDE